MSKLEFQLMDGARNNFVVFDNRKLNYNFDCKFVNNFNEKKTCNYDQVIIIEHPTRQGDAKMRIFNADSSEVKACGNATRCIADVIMSENSSHNCCIEVGDRNIQAIKSPQQKIKVNMGLANYDWQTIPLKKPVDNCLNLNKKVVENLNLHPINISTVNFGNPHLVLILKQANLKITQEYGPILEHNALFPEKCNVSFAEIENKSAIKLFVWERGVGITQACGTATCAVFANSQKLGLVNKQCTVTTMGGNLEVSLSNNQEIWFSGPIKYGKISHITIN